MIMIKRISAISSSSHINLNDSYNTYLEIVNILKLITEKYIKGVNNERQL